MIATKGDLQSLGASSQGAAEAIVGSEGGGYQAPEQGEGAQLGGEGLARSPSMVTRPLASPTRNSAGSIGKFQRVSRLVGRVPSEGFPEDTHEPEARRSVVEASGLEAARHVVAEFQPRLQAFGLRIPRPSLQRREDPDRESSVDESEVEILLFNDKDDLIDAMNTPSGGQERQLRHPTRPSAGSRRPSIRLLVPAS